MKILVINGPNLNMLGIREPEVYGSATYEALCHEITAHCAKNSVEVLFYQSNHEGALVDRIQQAYFEKVDGIVINPAAYTHTSIPTVEVHISKPEQREAFRQVSYIRCACVATISGKGFAGYLEAINILLEKKP